MSIVITLDSTCDIPQEIIDKFNFKIIPLHIVLGNTTYSDGINIQPDKIYEFVNKTKNLPKTTCANQAEFMEFFGKYASEYDDVIHFSISTKLSASFAQAELASKKFSNVHVIDGRQLSTGTALLALTAADMVKEGKGVKEIVNRINSLISNVQTSFVVDSIEYLHKGGRCSMLELLGANILKIHPMLQTIDGEIKVVSKFRGKMEKVIKDYFNQLKHLYPNPMTDYIFVTHTECDPAFAKMGIEFAKKEFGAKTVINCMANSTITCHCGKGTLGMLFINSERVVK